MLNTPNEIKENVNKILRSYFMSNYDTYFKQFAKVVNYSCVFYNEFNSFTH